MIKKVLMPGGKPSRVDRYFSDTYVRHNDELADGVRSFHDLAASTRRARLRRDRAAGRGGKLRRDVVQGPQG